MSRYWKFSLQGDGRGNVGPCLAFEEWANDEYFYSELVDGEERAVSIFRKYKTQMDMEFPDPSASDHAEIIDDAWLMCPNCIDAWESVNTFDGMLKCPMKGHLLHNPRYKRLGKID